MFVTKKRKLMLGTAIDKWSFRSKSCVLFRPFGMHNAHRAEEL